MAVHSRNSVLAKRLWNFLRITYFMMRKGLISKRKMLMDMNMMMKRGKVLRKSLSNLMSHHHHHHHSKHAVAHRGGFGLQEYEFSCSNSPNPVFFHVGGKRKHNYFPCINPPEDIEESSPEPSKAVVMLPKIEYSPAYSCNFPFGTPDLAPGEKLSPLLSPFSIRISNYSSDEEEEEEEGDEKKVDDEAEEFIRRFYEQLRAQSRTQLLQYEEVQYQQMLARGTH